MVRPLPVTEANNAAVGYVGTTPAEGLAQLDILRQLGCEPHHTVLEIGCGALVAGYPILQYLEPGRYCGIDPNRCLIEASSAIPEVNDAVQTRARSLAYRADFKCPCTEHDFGISHSVLSHVSSAQLDAFLLAVSLGPKTMAASIRLAEGNPYGSPGSPVHGAHFREWQYPGVSWFRLDDVYARAKQVGLKLEFAPEFTALMLRANPKSVHDWLVLRR